MALDNLQVDYLIDPAFQIENLAGKPAVGGSICVFEAGTDTKVITYQDFDGTENPFKIPLHADGRAVILADPSKSYDLYVYDSFNNLMFSRLNVTPNLSGNINITGSDVVIYNTDGTLDITQQSIQNNVRRYEINTKHKSFGVQEPLYFIEDSDSATIIGCRSQSGDYATTAYVESAISGKLDISSYSSQSGNFLTDKFEYDNSNHITAYNNSAFAGTEYEAGDNIDITNHIISVTGLPTDSDVQNAISSAVTNVENKFEYNTNNYITAYNNSAFAGTNYSAGDYVSIENDTINVTGLQPSGDYATHDDLTALQPSGDYATKTELESATSGKQDTLSAGDGISIVNNVISVTAEGGGIEQVSHDETLSGNGNDEPLGIANVEDFVKQNDLTAYQPAGDYYSASNPSGFITNDAITGLQPSGDYVTHDEMTAYQPTGDYYSASNPSGFITEDALTGLQPSGDYATHDDLTGYATTALVSSVSSELYSAISGISGDYELVAGSGVELVDDPNAKTTTINVTAEGGNKEVENLVTANSATWNTVSDKLDATAFSDVSGSFLTAHQDLSNYATTAQVADKLDTTAFSDVSGDFLTAIPESALSGYAEYSAISAKLAPNDIVVFTYGTQSAAYPYILSAYAAGKFCYAKYSYDDKNYYPLLTCQSANTAWGAYSGYNRATFGKLRAGSTSQSVWQDTVTTADLSLMFVDGASDKSGNPGYNYGWVANFLRLQEAGNYYSASNPSGFITAIPAGTMNESAFDYDANNKISAYNGSAFAGGSEVPEGVMSESGLEYNAVNEISGYNGSAIAQYGAEKQWLVHDDTLVHASNSAQYALGVNISAVAQLLGGIDETVLYDGESSGGTLYNNSIPLTESYKNFNTIKIMNGHHSVGEFPSLLLSAHQDAKIDVSFQDANTAQPLYIGLLKYSATDDTTLIQYFNRLVSFTTANSVTVTTNANNYNTRTFKVIGIGRKS